MTPTPYSDRPTSHFDRVFAEGGRLDRMFAKVAAQNLARAEYYRRATHPDYILIELLALPLQAVAWYWSRVFRFRRSAPMIVNIKYGWIK